MDNVLARRLEQFEPLSSLDHQLLDKVVGPVRDVQARTNLIGENEKPTAVRLIVDGFACRYKSLSNGRRQIVGYLMRGDFCDLHVPLLRAMDHSIATLSSCKVVEIPHHHILEMTKRPALFRALWVATLVGEGTLREWLLNIGQRPAVERVAHLFCELYLRMRSTGLPSEGRFHLPLTQHDVADSVGLSLVHVNRCLRNLSDLDLLTFRSRVVEIIDMERLREFCGFDPNYLHLDQMSQPALAG